MPETMPMSTALVRIYFDQTKEYYSESESKMVLIAMMAPSHAANAAARLLADATIWQEEAGILSSSTSMTAVRWMLSSSLWRALHARAIS